MKIYVYGPVTGFTSYPLAMQGFIRAFEYHGLEPIVADISGIGGETARRLSLGVPPENIESRLIFAMKPTPQMLQLATKHGFKVVGKHAGDVDKIPIDWKMAIEHETLTVAPSKWIADVICNDTGKSAMVSNPGIPSEYFGSTVRVELDDRSFDILHCCSSPVFPERKGTPQLLEAFPRVLTKYPTTRLTLVVPELRRPVKQLLGRMDAHTRRQTIVLTYPQGQHSSQMIGLYRRHHALVCPSRAEGAGLQPVEARALGIPVIQTTCTGFADYIPTNGTLFDHGIVPIAHGELENAWGDFGKAPTVSPDDIAKALLACIENYKELRQNSALHMSEMSQWSWENTTAKLARVLKEIGNE